MRTIIFVQNAEGAVKLSGSFYFFKKMVCLNKKKLCVKCCGVEIEKFLEREWGKMKKMSSPFFNMTSCKECDFETCENF